MDNVEEIKQTIDQAKNIYIIPQQNNESESIVCALALFYTLKELNKNVNLLIDNLSPKFNFLVPSLDFVSYPRNLVISIPKKSGDISQVYYEKGEETLKIHLTLDKGVIKKEDVSFYFTEAKPDLIITLGVQSFKKQLLERLDSFAFLMESPILNIDNKQENEKFGKINLIEESSLSEIIINLIKSINESLINKDAATCLLAGLINYSENFTSQKTSYKIFEAAGFLAQKGAAHQRIIENLSSAQRDENPAL